MKEPVWTALSGVAAVAAAVFVRKALAAAWPGDTEPPLNPADRRISWREALGWAAASGVGAGVSRLLARRAAASAWTAATHEAPPGI